MLVRFLLNCCRDGLEPWMMMCLKRGLSPAEVVGWVDICVSSDSRHQASTEGQHINSQVLRNLLRQLTMPDPNGRCVKDHLSCLVQSSADTTVVFQETSTVNPNYSWDPSV